MGMLKELDIFVRSHLSPLKPEQVALMRARWEREKRKQKGAPAPVIPTPVRPKPVASATPGGAVPAPPRPVASAAPGAIPLEERRREKGKKRKKGKKSLVDQEAVAQNISRTLASIKGPVAKKGAHRREEGPSFREVEEQKRRDEKEREKTLVRVTEFITVSELANILKVPAKEIVGFAFKELARRGRAGDGLRGPGGRRRRRDHAATDRSDFARQERGRPAGCGDQQDRPAHRQRAEGKAGPAGARGGARRVRGDDPRHADLRQDGQERPGAARPDPAAGGAARSEGQPRPPGPGHGARGDARPRQGPARHDPRPERHAARRR